MDENKQYLNPVRQHALLLIWSAVLLLPFLGAVHLFDWDEINFAESAREMLITGNYLTVQVDFEPFWEKPPFFFWLQALCMNLFGVNEFAARLPNAIAGILTLQALLFIGRKHLDQAMSLRWPLMYMASLTPFFYFKSGIIDPWFNLWIFGSIYQLYLSWESREKSLKHFALSGMFLGLAFLTKGPVAILLVGLSGLIWWAMHRFRYWFGFKHLLVLGLAMLLLPALWLAPEIHARGFWFLKTFIGYQIELFSQPVASHGQPWYYHAVVLLFGAFPASVLALPLLFRNQEGNLERWMRILFWVVLIVFSAVTTKIVHYSSLCFLPLSFLAARALERKPAGWNKVILLFIGFVLASLMIALPVLMTNDALRDSLKELIRDKQMQAALTIKGNWNLWMVIPGLILMTAWLTLSFVPRKKAIAVLFVLPIGYALSMRILVPAVEQHSQRPVIAFYQRVSEQKPYFVPYRFKTYAHLFYGRTAPLPSLDPLREYRRKWKVANGHQPDEVLTGEARKWLADAETQWLIKTELNRPVYFICLERKAHELQEYPELTEVFREGGYVGFGKVKGEQ